jgi:hemoglobin
MILAILPTIAQAGDGDAEAAKQMESLVSMCNASADARSDRQAATSLYERLGGYDKIHALTTEIVRLHKVNERFRLMMRYVDGEDLATSVADFMAAGTGGTAEYKGRDIHAAHAHLEFNEGDFLSAGSDVIKAMQNLGYGQEEIDEVVCILVSMKHHVIAK